MQAERAALQAEDVYLVYLPAHSQELSEIQPIWNQVKSHELTRCSCRLLAALKREVETTLA